MFRKLLALVVGVAAVSMVGYAADDKKDAKKDGKVLEGKLVCGKCTLGETDACSNVLKVKEGGKEVNYYIKDKGNKEAYHKPICPSGKEVNAKVTGGKVVEKDGKKTIEGGKVELVK